MTDRAVSEVLGYVLIISLVTVTIAIVMTSGISGLEASQQAEQVNNMERGFDVLAHNIDQFVDGTAPSRATELRLADGSIGYGPSTTINISVDGELVGNQTLSTEPIQYDSGDGTQITYEAGAIVRTDDSSSVMLREPRFVLTDDSIVITGVRTRPMGGTPTDLSTPGTVLIRGEHLGTDTASAERAPEASVNIIVETDRPDAWAAYFERHDVGTVDTFGRTVAYTIDDTELDDDLESIHIVQPRTRFTLID